MPNVPSPQTYEELCRFLAMSKRAVPGRFVLADDDDLGMVVVMLCHFDLGWHGH